MLTRRGEVVAGLAVTAGLIALMWTATLLGNAVTGGPERPVGRESSQPTQVREGSLPTGAPIAVRPVPTATRAARSRPPSPGHDRARRLDVTAYCWTGSPTASGLWPQIGMAAGNDWPFGTRLRVEGVGVVTIQDRYGSGTSLDVYLGREGCEQRARQFGRQRLMVEVIGRG